MTEVDEIYLVSLLRQRRQNLMLLDGHVWDSSEPAVRQDISECLASFVFLWDPDICPKLPTIIDTHGRLEGPQVGPVIQFQRSLVRDNYLLSGRLAASWRNTEEELLMKDAWWALGKSCAVKVTVKGSSKVASMYKSGKDSSARAKAGEFGLRARSVKVFFSPI